MKKLLTICLLLATTFTVNAQSGKPTKEQTVQFIEDYFANNRLSTGVCGFTDTDNQKNFFTTNISNLEIQFDEKSCLMIFNFDRFDNNKIYTQSGKLQYNFYNKVKYIIDLSKIENITVINDLYGDNKTSEIDLVFNASPGYKIETFKNGNEDKIETVMLPNIAKRESNIIIPINFYSTTDTNFNHSEHNKKITQAFNHLRKLCGAPEPISFDGN